MIRDVKFIWQNISYSELKSILKVIERNCSLKHQMHSLFSALINISEINTSEVYQS